MAEILKINIMSNFTLGTVLKECAFEMLPVAVCLLNILMNSTFYRNDALVTD